MDPVSPGSPELEPDVRRSLGRLSLLIVAFILLAVLTVRPHAVRAAVDEFESMMAGKSDAAPAAPAESTAALEGRISTMTPQGQAELLLAELMNRSASALDVLSARVDGWRGVLQQTPRLTKLLESAMNSDDLRVRGAALDLYLDVYDIGKDSGSVSTLERRAAEDPGSRAWALWMLGALGNRGIEPIGVLREELSFVNDPNEETRAWAIQALATLGTNEAIDPLLDALRNDRSPIVRERAACGLAQSGMFTREQRRSAVPRLLDLAEDPALDVTTRGWVFHALQDITGANAGSDPRAWRRWWQEHGS